MLPTMHFVLRGVVMEAHSFMAEFVDARRSIVSRIARTSVAVAALFLSALASGPAQANSITILQGNGTTVAGTLNAGTSTIFGYFASPCNNFTGTGPCHPVGSIYALDQASIYNATLIDPLIKAGDAPNTTNAQSPEHELATLNYIAGLSLVNVNKTDSNATSFSISYQYFSVKLGEAVAYFYNASGGPISVSYTQTGTGAGLSHRTEYGTLAVPSPIVGAGLPGLLAACGALFILARRRRKATT
jgi:hypothetical protein